MMRWSQYYIWHHIILAIHLSWRINDVRGDICTNEERYFHVIRYVWLNTSRVWSVLILRIFEVMLTLTGDNRKACADNWEEHALPGNNFVHFIPESPGVTVVHLAFPLRLIMQFSSEAFFIAANSHSYFCRPRAFVRHPICISRAPFRDLHSSQPQCFRRVAGNT